MSGYQPHAIAPTGPVRVGFAGGRRVYEITAWDDRRNLLKGLDVGDRFRILEAMVGAVEELADPLFEQRRRETYVLWAALQLFSVLRQRARVQWGHGPLGMADAAPTRVRRLPARGSMPLRFGQKPVRRRPKFLLKNAIDLRLVDPRYRNLNLAAEIRRLHRRYRAAHFDSEVFVEGTRLRRSVLQRLQRPSEVQDDDLEQWDASLRSGVGIRPPGFTGTLTHMAIANLLSYYGLGAAAKKGGKRGYRIAPWRLRFVVEQLVINPEGFLFATPWLRLQMRALPSRTPRHPASASPSFFQGHGEPQDRQHARPAETPFLEAGSQGHAGEAAEEQGDGDGEGG